MAVRMLAVHAVRMGGAMECVISRVMYARFCLGHLNSPSDLLEAFACDPSAPSNSGKVNPGYKASSAIGSHAGACSSNEWLGDRHEHRTGFESLGRFGQDDPVLRVRGSHSSRRSQG